MYPLFTNFFEGGQKAIRDAWTGPNRMYVQSAALGIAASMIGSLLFSTPKVRKAVAPVFDRVRKDLKKGGSDLHSFFSEHRTGIGVGVVSSAISCLLNGEVLKAVLAIEIGGLIYLFTEMTSGKNFLETHGVNLTEVAKSGKLHPAIGRDKEINRIVLTLFKRNKPNPMLTGKPGVGKTALVEGLALKISKGEIPKFKNMEIISIRASDLVGDTQYMGTFEGRMNSIIDFCKKNRNIIIFIDEIHTLMGLGSKGSKSGPLDGANILKDALARGEIRLIGATTSEEYEHIKKDKAMQRRFDEIDVEEPKEEDAIAILKQSKKSYEEYHECTISDEACESAVRNSKYLPGCWPDRAFNLLDLAGAQADMSRLNGVTPVINAPEIDQISQRARLDRLNRDPDNLQLV